MQVALTSDTRGTFEGRGQTWWDRMILGTLPPENKDSRPKLVRFDDCADVLIERVDLHNSPSWNMLVNAVRAEIRDVVIRTNRYDSGLSSAKDRVEEWLIDKVFDLIPPWVLQPEDLNTDGIDPVGIDFWIHDVDRRVGIKHVGPGRRRPSRRHPWSCGAAWSRDVDNH